MDFVLQYFWWSIMALEFDMGFCRAVLTNLKLSLWYDMRK